MKKDEAYHQARLAEQEKQAKQAERWVIEDGERRLDEERDKAKNLGGQPERAKRNMKAWFARSRERIDLFIRNRAANLRHVYGTLKVEESGAFDSRKVNWSKIWQRAEIRVQALRGVKDKVSEDSYVLLVSKWTKLGGENLTWSYESAYSEPELRPKCPLHGADLPIEKRANCEICMGWVGASQPVWHGGIHKDVELIFSSGVQTHFPPVVSIKPYMILLFELVRIEDYEAKALELKTSKFRRNKPFNPYNLCANVGGRGQSGSMAGRRARTVAWGAFPCIDSKFRVIRGKFKCPLMRGEMDENITHYQKYEKILQDDLENWCGNLYFEVIPFPRQKDGKGEFDLEKKYASEMLGLDKWEEPYWDLDRPDLWTANKARIHTSSGYRPAPLTAYKHKRAGTYKALLSKPTRYKQILDSDTETDSGKDVSSATDWTMSDTGSESPLMLTQPYNYTMHNFSMAKIQHEQEQREMETRSKSTKDVYEGEKDSPKSFTTKKSAPLFSSPNKSRGSSENSLGSDADDHTVTTSTNTTTHPTTTNTSTNPKGKIVDPYAKTTVHKNRPMWMPGELRKQLKQEDDEFLDEDKDKLMLQLREFNRLMKEENTFQVDRSERWNRYRHSIEPDGTFAEYDYRWYVQLQYVVRAIRDELGLRSLKSLRMWFILTLGFFTTWGQLYLRGIGVYLGLWMLSIPISTVTPFFHGLITEYQPHYMWPFDEVFVVSVGNIVNILMISILIFVGYLFKRSFGTFPEHLSKFVFLFCIGIYILPIVNIPIDLYNDEEDSDVMRLIRFYVTKRYSVFFGVVTFIVIYLLVIVAITFMIYFYTMHFHLNGILLDCYTRINVLTEEIADRRFLPMDFEVSQQELDYIVTKAERWRGRNGERRKTLVEEIITTDVNDPDYHDVQVRIAIYTLDVDDPHYDKYKPSKIFREFYVLSNGAIVEAINRRAPPAAAYIMGKVENTLGAKDDRAVFAPMRGDWETVATGVPVVDNL
eukprot:TRINITY_DN54484_c0_g1_i1.p1 TRINITY_DN54484_c0_g1~~TRINITY_DN54484_c0_g1_i1.p1  ORF type:complete len:1078 (+),score=100.01 TRINITY_DN54484_c0_g1_i1:273-3236(+)